MWFAVLSILFYLISVLRIAPILLTSQVAGADVKRQKTPFFLTALLAVVFHLISTFPLLGDLAEGQNFSIMEVASLMSVMIRYTRHDRHVARQYHVVCVTDCLLFLHY